MKMQPWRSLWACCGSGRLAQKLWTAKPHLPSFFSPPFMSFMELLHQPWTNTLMASHLSQSKIQSSYHGLKTPHDFLLLHSPSFTPFQPHWPPCCSWNMPARHISGYQHLVLPLLGSSSLIVLPGSRPHFLQASVQLLP